MVRQGKRWLRVIVNLWLIGQVIIVALLVVAAAQGAVH